MLRAGLAVEAEGPERREPVGRQEGEEHHAARGIALERAVQLLDQRDVVERRDDPDGEHRRREQPHRVRRHGRGDAQLGRPGASSTPALRRVAAARRAPLSSKAPSPMSPTSATPLGNTRGGVALKVALRCAGVSSARSATLCPAPLKARESLVRSKGLPSHGIAEPVDGMPATGCPSARTRSLQHGVRERADDERVAVLATLCGTPRSTDDRRRSRGYRMTSTASMDVARPPSAAMSAASRRTGPSATSNACGSSVVNRRRMMSVRTPITESRGPVMPTSVM